MRRYVKCNPAHVDRLKNVNFTPLSDFPEEVRQRVRTELEAMAKLNATTLKPLVLGALDAGDSLLLRAYDAVFPEVYRSVYAVLGGEGKRRLLQAAPPSDLDVRAELEALDLAARLREARHALKDQEAVRVTEAMTDAELARLDQVASGEFEREYLGVSATPPPPSEVRFTRPETFYAALLGVRFVALRRCMTSCGSQ